MRQYVLPAVRTIYLPLCRRLPYGAREGKPPSGVCSQTQPAAAPWQGRARTGLVQYLT